MSNFRRVTIRGRWATGGRAVIVLVAAGVVAAGLAMVLGATSAPSPDELAIQSTIQGALQARMTLEVPPMVLPVELPSISTPFPLLGNVMPLPRSLSPVEKLVPI